MTTAHGRRWGRRWTAWVPLLACLISPGRVLAQPRHSAESVAEGTVAVVGMASDPVTMRLTAELRFAGFDVEVIEPREHASADRLVALTNARGVDALVQVDASTVWISGRASAESVQLSLSNEADPERAVAVITVELVRARLEPEPDPPEPDPLPDPPWSPPPHPRFFLAFEAAFGGSPGGVPAAAHVRGRARYAPHRSVGLVLSGTAPLHAVSVRGAEGKTTLLTGWVGVGPWVGLRGKEHPVVLPSLSATVGPAFVGMRGQASGRYQAREAHLVDAMLEVVAAVDVAVWRSLRVRGSVGAGACARQIRVRFAERTAATWCRPEGFGTLGVGVVLP